MRSRTASRLAAFALLVTLVLGVSPGVLAQEELAGELNVYYQQYYLPDAYPEVAAVVEGIAAAYEEMHPGVTINLVPDVGPGVDYDTWLAARMAAGETPDIAWQQFYARNVRADDWWVPLNEYFEMPNPYIEEGVPGHERWMDSFPGFVMGQTRAPDGNWYQVSIDWVETALFYNIAMFEEAGVEPEWESWGDFVADMRAIRDVTGADPIGVYMTSTGWSNWVWADDIFLTVAWADIAQDFMMDKYTELQPGLDFRQLNPEEIAKAIIEGKLDATDPRMDHYLRISKEFTELLPVDYIGIVSLEDLVSLFLSEQIAAVWGGTWNLLNIEQAPFEYGVTYLPPFTPDDAPSATGTAYRVGGPSSCGQYGIPQSAAEAGKLDLAVDYLMYMSAPQNFGPVVLAFRAFIPMVAGIEGGDVVENFGAVAALPERLFSDPGARLTLEAGDAWTTLMQSYFLGQIDEEEAKTGLQEIWMEGALALCADQGYDWCPE